LIQARWLYPVSAKVPPWPGQCSLAVEHKRIVDMLLSKASLGQFSGINGIPLARKLRARKVLMHVPLRGCRAAFTLIEAVVGMAVAAVVFISLYAGIIYAMATVRVSRESLQATQVIQSKMEVIRLCNWNQVTTNNFIPTTFQEVVYAPGKTNNGVTYSGTVIITNAPVSESYSNSLKQVTIAVTWKSGNVQRNRQMNTLVSEYGLQNYIY
jgi:type II secretory pathway pseudopilin PulG